MADAGETISLFDKLFGDFKSWDDPEVLARVRKVALAIVYDVLENDAEYSDDRKDMAKIRITQTRSRIGSTSRQKKTLDALGLRKMQKTVELEANPQIMGMVNKVRHLIRIEEL